jgi:hypothetical protein
VMLKSTKRLRVIGNSFLIHSVLAYFSLVCLLILRIGERNVLMITDINVDIFFLF